MADSRPIGPTGQDYEDLPEVRVTMNQVVAYNVSYFRLRRGLTQEQLGKRLEAITGRVWSKATVSALERSWYGTRIRQFDADDLIALSRALDFPVNALLLPPEDDGVDKRYTFLGAGIPPESTESGQVEAYGSADQLLEQLFISEDEIDASYPGDSAFSERIAAAFLFYDGDLPNSGFVAFRRGQPLEGTPEDRSREATELRGQAQVLRKVMTELERAARRLELIDDDQVDRPDDAPRED